MRLGRDVRVDANAETGALLQLVGRGDHRVQLGGRLDVQEPDARPDRLLELRAGLAHPREHNRRGVESGRECPAQLADGHDIGPGAKRLEHLEDPDIPVGLDRVANAVRHVVQGVVQRVILSPDEVGAVHINRRSDPLRDRAEERRVEA